MGWPSELDRCEHGEHLDAACLKCENARLQREVKRLQPIVDALTKYLEAKATSELTAERRAAIEAEWQGVMQQVETLAAEAAKEEK